MHVRFYDVLYLNKTPNSQVNTQTFSNSDKGKVKKNLENYTSNYLHLHSPKELMPNMYIMDTQESTPGTGLSFEVLTACSCIRVALMTSSNALQQKEEKKINILPLKVQIDSTRNCQIFGILLT